MSRIVLTVLSLGLVVLCTALSGGGDQGPASKLELATFSVEITPPVGSPNCLPPERVKSVEHPLYAKGVILRQSDETVVLLVLDLLAVNNDSNLAIRESVAKAVGTTPSRVTLHAIHQHTAPTLDATAQAILNTVKGAPELTDLKYADAITEKIAESAKAALKTMTKVTHVGSSWAPVDRVASNRRIRLPDGKIQIRFSSSKDPQAIAAPEGKIDGFLRTVSFFDGQTPLAYLHYFASHPQSFYGDGRVTPDMPGLAREQLEKATKVPHLYFTACGGDVGMGKYNDGKPERRGELVERLIDGMKRSIAKPTLYPVTEFRWSEVELPLASRTEANFADEAAHKALSDAKLAPNVRYKGAVTLAFNQRVREKKHPFELRGLALGPVRILHFPGESFVEYQLWTQQQFPDQFTAVAAYGDCAMWYIPDDAAYRDRGGYEQTFAQAAPCEAAYKKQIRSLMNTLNGEKDK
jgi:hypothetical protein